MYMHLCIGVPGNWGSPATHHKAKHFTRSSYQTALSITNQLVHADTHAYGVTVDFSPEVLSLISTADFMYQTKTVICYSSSLLKKTQTLTSRHKQAWAQTHWRHVQKLWGVELKLEVKCQDKQIKFRLWNWFFFISSSGVTHYESSALNQNFTQIPALIMVRKWIHAWVDV